MDAATLRSAMLDRITVDHARALVPHYNAALLAANCTTVNRSAMMAAQLGHESASLRYFEEIASGAAYEGRKDLGNTQRGDGRRYKGRGPIQLTGRNNYGAFSRWCHGRGLVDTPTWFVDRPTEVAIPRWGFLAAAWYWVVARPKINGMCDRADLDGVTRAINGGRNGIADRRMRWDHCRRLGDRLLPATPVEDDMTPEQDRLLRDVHRQLTTAWPARRWTQPGEQQPNLTLVDYVRGLDQIVASRFTLDGRPVDESRHDTSTGHLLSLRAEVEALARRLDGLIGRPAK